MCISIRFAIATLCTVFVAVCLSPLSMVLADDLFSDVAMESVFRAEKDADSSVPTADATVDGAQRVTGAGSLANMLERAGFKPKKMDQSIVSVTIRRAGWSLPVLMSVAVDQDRLDMVMLLSEIGDESEWDTTRLTQLFAANADESTLFFALNRSRKRVELRRTMSNRSLTPVLIKAEISKMAMVAETYEDAWSNVIKRPAEPAVKSTNADSSSNAGTQPSQPAVVENTSTNTATNPASTQPNATGFTLVGRWSTTLASGEALAVQIATDGTFQMVVAKSGKTTVSKGMASRAGDQLTLAESSGTKIVGTYRQTTADAFSLRIGGNASATLNFQRAK